MAITDYKITNGEITQRNVKSAPDVLSDTPNNNKAVFDNLTEHFIGKYNDLIDNIDTDFVDSSEFAEGLTVTDKVRWRYALTKGTSIGLNFSGNITQITTGFRTIVGDIDGLTETDFMDCYLSINGTDYECGDSYASGNSIMTSAVINGVTVEIIYDITNGNITLEHATNPLDTLYWNVSIYRSVAEKVPRKALPASVSNDGYTELSSEIDRVENHDGKWKGVDLEKDYRYVEVDGYYPFVIDRTSERAYLNPLSGYWDKLAAVDTTSVKGDIYYRKIGNEVTLKFELKYYGSITAGTNVTLVSGLDSKFVPKTPSKGGLGAFMASPRYMVITELGTATDISSSLIIDLHGDLAVRIHGAISGTAGTYNGHHVNSEWTYNTKMEDSTE